MSRTTRSKAKFTHCSCADTYVKRHTWGWWNVTRRDDYEAQDRERFARFGRDGLWSETGRNQAFKELVRRDRRARDRMAIRALMQGEEDVEFTTRTHGKRFIWSVW